MRQVSRLRAIYRFELLKWRFWAVLVLAGGQGIPVSSYAASYPEVLSEWGQLVWSGESLAAGSTSHAYSLSEPLFSDYAVKFRTVFVPEGTSAGFDAEGRVKFPLGSVLTKTFAYRRGDIKHPDNEDWIATGFTEAGLQRHRVDLDMREFRLLETRLLIREPSGWVALPYVWNDEQNEAVLEPLGALKNITLELPSGETRQFTYEVPNRHQCVRCHGQQTRLGRELRPIGPQRLLLEKNIRVNGESVSQVAHWRYLGILQEQSSQSARPANEDLWLQNPEAHRARRYLHANCAHCHNSKGYAASSGLHLGYGVRVPREFGVCKPPTSSAGISGAVKYDISPGAPGASEVVRRMASEESQVMMPEQGRVLRHDAGIRLVSMWIKSIAVECE